MPSRQPLPTSWAEYERGGRRDSNDSTSSRVHFADEEANDQHGYGTINRSGSFSENLRRRRSSMSMRISSIRQAGGVNSIDNFARSWTRAAAFPEIANNVRPSFRFTDSSPTPDEEAEEEAAPQDQRSLLRSALLHEGRRRSDNAIDEEDTVGPKVAPHHVRGDSSFHVEPQLQSVFGGSYGSSYGSAGMIGAESSLRRGSRMGRQYLTPSAPAAEIGEHEPLLVKQIEDENGEVVNVIVGQSTLPQTVFNSVNVLVGVGLLALPLAIRYSGWLVGILFLSWASLVTSYTAKLLAKCLDVDSSLITFADLAYVSFGSKARIFTSILFSLELLAACVALIVLFADSLVALAPVLNNTQWKLVCGVILVPLSFLPLSLLSFTSIMGIVSCTLIVVAVFVDGLIKPDAPGSLRSPMPTYLFPDNWATVPISLGLLMSPWGGHGVFPNIYRDMRHPYKYRRAVNITYIITSLLDFFMAIVGLLMFGDSVRDEVTSNILLTKGYPPWISILICICIAIIPLTKIPLNARPIISTVEVMCGLDPRGAPQGTPLLSGQRLSRAFIRLLSTCVFVLLAIIVPSFDRIMSLLGSVACFTICVILPCAFHLKLFGKEIARPEWVLNWVLIVFSSILAIVSTAFNFLPKESLGV